MSGINPAIMSVPFSCRISTKGGSFKKIEKKKSLFIRLLEITLKNIFKTSQYMKLCKKSDAKY